MPNKKYYAVLDFEANCSSKENEDHEIIEFPVVLVNAETGELVSEFHEYVQLVTHENLSDFIKELTHITDDQVRSPIALTWKECLDELDAWCERQNLTIENTTMITCGDWDLKTMLPKQLELTQTVLPYRLNKLLNSWCNIKLPFKRYTKCRDKCGMAGMLFNLNLELEGHHHSGIDDSRNIANICRALTKLGADMTKPNRRREMKLFEF